MVWLRTSWIYTHGFHTKQTKTRQNWTSRSLLQEKFLKFPSKIYHPFKKFDPYNIPALKYLSLHPLEASSFIQHKNNFLWLQSKQNIYPCEVALAYWIVQGLCHSLLLFTFIVKYRIGTKDWLAFIFLFTIETALNTQ